MDDKLFRCLPFKRHLQKMPTESERRFQPSKHVTLPMNKKSHSREEQQR